MAQQLFPLAGCYPEQLIAKNMGSVDCELHMLHVTWQDSSSS